MLHGTDLASFSAPSGVLQALSTDPAADTTIGLRLTQYDFFFQDDWAVAKNLSLNVGLRYEYMTVPHETNNRIEKHLVLAGPVRSSTGDRPYQAVIKAGNQRSVKAVQGLQQFLGGRQRICDADGNNFAPTVVFNHANPGVPVRILESPGFGTSFDTQVDPRSLRLVAKVSF